MRLWAASFLAICCVMLPSLPYHPSLKPYRGKWHIIADNKTGRWMVKGLCWDLLLECYPSACCADRLAGAYANDYCSFQEKERSIKRRLFYFLAQGINCESRTVGKMLRCYILRILQVSLSFRSSKLMFHLARPTLRQQNYLDVNTIEAIYWQTHKPQSSHQKFESLESFAPTLTHCLRNKFAHLLSASKLFAFQI